MYEDLEDDGNDEFITSFMRIWKTIYLNFSMVDTGCRLDHPHTRNHNGSVLTFLREEKDV